MSTEYIEVAERERRLWGSISVPTELEASAERQGGVVSREQLHRAGSSQEHVRAGVCARRWQVIGRRVVVLHNAPLTSEQRRWAAVLLPGKVAVLAGPAAAIEAGLSRFDDDQIQVVIAHGSNARYPAWMTVHNSGRLTPIDIARTVGVPRTKSARAIIDAAARQPHPRPTALLCGALQQRVTSTWALERGLAAIGSVQHVAVMRDVLADIAGSAHTLDVLDFGPLAKQGGLPPPRRQAVRCEPGVRKRFRLETARVVDQLGRVRSAHHK